MKKDKEKDNVFTLVPAGSDLERDAAIAVKRGKERLAADEAAERSKRNSKQFLRMEEPVRHAAHMAQIMEDLIIKAEEDGGVEMDEHLVWGVLELGDMVKALRPFYLKQDDDEERDDEGDAAS